MMMVYLDLPVRNQAPEVVAASDGAVGLARVVAVAGSDVELPPYGLVIHSSQMIRHCETAAGLLPRDRWIASIPMSSLWHGLSAPLEAISDAAAAAATVAPLCVVRQG